MTIKELLYWLLYTENYAITQNVAGGIGIARAGKTVMVTVQNIRNLPAGTTRIATLPTRFCPYHGVYNKVNDPNNTTNVRSRIASDGSFDLINYGAAINSDTNATVTMCYVAKRGL